MRNTRRLAALGATVIVATATLTGGAAAQQTDAAASAYSGRASADAMTINLFGQTITTSAAAAEVDPDRAKATATQVLLGPVSTQELSVEQQGVGNQSNHPETCTGNELEAVPGVQRAEITCGGVDAEVVDNGGNAHAVGAGVVLEASVSTVLDTLGLQEPVAGTLDQVLEEALNPLVEALTGNPVGDLVQDGTETVQDVLGDVLSFESTARVVIAPARADVVVTGESAVSTAHGQGIRIELLPAGAGATDGLLPEDLEAGEPLVTITVGNAQITDTFNRSTGQRTTDTTAATAIVEFGSKPLTDALGLPDQTITVAAGQSFCIPGLEGTPLETCINLAAAGADADGNPFVDGGSIQLFKGVNGGVDLAVGRAATTTAVAAQPAPAAAAPAGELPRTGGPAALPVIGGALLAAAAVARRLSRSSRS